MILRITAVCLLVCHVVSAVSDLLQPVVNVPGLGSVRGTYGRSHFSERKLYEFLGINYAKPPSGERRFKPPEDFGPWMGVYYDASKMRQRCPQVDEAYYPSPPPDKLDVKKDIEDCLVVNVFTPQINPTAGMPVMFYIHGGSFYLGSAYDFLPDFLLEDNIVLVVPQYRLGPLGFLSLNTSEVPGNMGMLDILLALRWVKAHIRSFGGDASKITVVGQSAGAAAASSLLISPMVEKGLFDKMIIQSGSILGLWTVDDNPIRSAKGISKSVGCQSEDLDNMTACLKSVPAVDLMKAHAKYIKEAMRAGGRGVGGASLVVQGPGKFLDRHPRDAFADGARMNIPIMGGTTRDEGTTFLTAFYDLFQLGLIADDHYFQRNVTRDLLKFFGYNDPHGLLNDAYQNLYFGNKVTHLRDMYAGLADMCGVLLLKQSTYNVLRSMSYTGRSFAYSFDFYGGVSKLRASEPEWDKAYPFPAGVGHSDDLGYLFPSVNHKYSPKELILVRTMTKLWTNFITFGYPAMPDGPFPWPSMSTAYGPYLRITSSPQVRDNFLEEYTIAAREGFLPSRSPPSHTPLFGVLYGAIIALTLLW